jgi:hypothetical protein
MLKIWPLPVRINISSNILEDLAVMRSLGAVGVESCPPRIFQWGGPGLVGADTSLKGVRK